MSTCSTLAHCMFQQEWLLFANTNTPIDSHTKVFHLTKRSKVYFFVINIENEVVNLKFRLFRYRSIVDDDCVLTIVVENFETEGHFVHFVRFERHVVRRPCVWGPIKRHYWWPRFGASKVHRLGLDASWFMTDDGHRKIKSVGHNFAFRTRPSKLAWSFKLINSDL